MFFRLLPSSCFHLLSSLLLLLGLSVSSPSFCYGAPSLPESASPVEALLFDAPTGWRHAETPADSPYVKIFIVGTGKKGYPPSINLCIEPFSGSLQEYIKRVQKINQEEGGTWKDLGAFQTPAGKGDLSQLDLITQFGPVRMLHFILVDKGHAYIFTAAARRDEFSLYYKEFFAAIRSLRFGELPSLP